MKSTENEDQLLAQAVEAIGSGEILALEAMLTKSPWLVQKQLRNPTEGYFANPYLLWFVADNPIKLGKLPQNIVEITALLVETVKRESPDTAGQQIDYTLALVATGHTPRECGVQLTLIDLLADAGAAPRGILGTLANGNIAAAHRLIERGAELTLATAVGLDWIEDVTRLAKNATSEEKLAALTVAAFYGNSSMVSFLLGIGAKPNGYPENTSGFHQHATPLHQAVSSACTECVKLLAKAGASLEAKDKIYGGTPKDWADYLLREGDYDKQAKKQLALIYGYLIGKETT